MSIKQGVNNPYIVLTGFFFQIFSGYYMCTTQKNVGWLLFTKLEGQIVVTIYKTITRKICCIFSKTLSRLVSRRIKLNQIFACHAQVTYDKLDRTRALLYMLYIESIIAWLVVCV